MLYLAHKNRVLYFSFILNRNKNYNEVNLEIAYFKKFKSIFCNMFCVLWNCTVLYPFISSKTISANRVWAAILKALFTSVVSR